MAVGNKTFGCVGTINQGKNQFKMICSFRKKLGFSGENCSGEKKKSSKLENEVKCVKLFC